MTDEKILLEEAQEDEAPSKKAKSSDPKPNKLGIIQKKWSGVPMWVCSHCGAQTFVEGDLDNHPCRVKSSD